MIKSLKQYLSLRGLLARRLKTKKREIEAIKAKNRIFVSQCGAIDLSEIDMIGTSSSLGKRSLVFFHCYREMFRIDFHDSCSDEDIKKITLLAGEQLKQLKTYD